MERSAATLVVVLTVTVFLGFCYYGLSIEFNGVSNKHNALKADYENLSDDYDNVSSRYEVLLTNYNSLTEEFDDLAREYEISYSTRYQEGYTHGYLQGNMTGYENGYIQGVSDGAGRGYDIRDPTFKEVLQFISSDRTDDNQYDEENYTCVDFAADLKNNALKAGYTCGHVYIQFPDSAHTIVCFNSTDGGLIFVEPQIDEIMSLTLGQPYWDRTKYKAPEYNDTVVRFAVAW